MHQTLDFGTKEAQKHGKYKLEARGLSNGGAVISTGLRNLIPDLLELLYDEGHLSRAWEAESAADRRVANGRGFQELVCAFRSKGKDIGAAQIIYNIMPTLEGHIGGERDVSETVYNATMRQLGRHAMIVYAVCIEGRITTQAAEIIKALDAIPKAMETAEHLVKLAIDTANKK